MSLLLLAYTYCCWFQSCDIDDDADEDNDIDEDNNDDDEDNYNDDGVTMKKKIITITMRDN